MTGTVCDTCNTRKDNHGNCTFLPGKKVCQGCSKAHKSCKVNSRPVSGYRTKNNDGGESPRKRQKIVSKVVIATSEDEVAKEMGKAVDEADEDSSQGEDDVGDNSEVETEVGGISHETQSQWSNVTLVEWIAWRRGNSLLAHIDHMQWQVEVTECQEEILRDQVWSLARMADVMEKTTGSTTKFADAMELFACRDHYLQMQEIGRSGNEQEEVPLKSAWKDRMKRAEIGNGSGSGSGSGSGDVDAEATLQ